MTRQDELNEAWCKYTGKCSTEVMQALAFALRWCDAHPNWVSVEDGLPRMRDMSGQSDDVLVAYEGGIGLNYYNWGSKCWLDFGAPVTHWMPLPAPPAGVKCVGKNDPRGYDKEGGA